jgi:hypothetical protein
MPPMEIPTTRHRSKTIRICNEMFRGIEKQSVIFMLLTHAAPFGFNMVVQVAVSSVARASFITHYGGGTIPLPFKC